MSCRLEGIDDDGKRAIIHQRAVTGTAAQPEAVVTHVYAFVPLSSKKDEKPAGGAPKKKAPPPRVPEDAREIAFWNIPVSAGLDFAKLTGDFNPIHWIPPAARAAGFKNVILHGFATLARAFIRTHDASVWEAARRAELEHEMNAKLWADGLAALRRGNLDELPGLALDKWNVMRADLGLPPRPRAPTGAEIKRAREMRLAGTLAPDADIPFLPDAELKRQ